MQRTMKFGSNEKLNYLLYLMLVGSVMGWCIEVAFRTVKNGQLVIPGFLIGPYCPIYGFGILIIILFCKHRSLFVSYWKIFLYSSVLEYVISFFAENIFGKLLWDYSGLPLSIGTRVSLFFSCIWGALGIIVLLFLEPVLRGFYNKYEKKLLPVIKVGITIIIVDFIVTCTLIL